MPTFDLKIRKVKRYNPIKKMFGYATRAIINGTETFESVAEEASRNTTINKYELAAALGIAAEQFARALKNGYAIDLGPIGKIYPNVTSKWTETPEEQVKSDLKPGVRYDASTEIKEAVAGCRLSWEKVTEEEEIVEEEVVEDDEPPAATPPANATYIPVTFKYQNNTTVEREYYVGQRVTEADAPEHAEGMAWKYLPFTMPEVEGIVITDCPEYDVEDYRKITIRWKDSAAGINVEQEYSIGEIVEAPEPPAGKHWDTDIIGKPAVPMRVSNIFAVAD